MRSGHALHNFFSSAIINSTLSTFAIGNVALFGYANRFAAGASAIAVGPHSNIFHAQIAKAWADHTPASVIESARNYLAHIAPIYVLTVIAVWLTLSPMIGFITNTNTNMPLDALTKTFLLLSVWYGVIQPESVFVAIIIVAHRAITLLLVNGFFAIVFYAISHAPLALHEYALLPVAAILAQLISLALFALTANRIFRQHFGAGQTNAVRL